MSTSGLADFTKVVDINSGQPLYPQSFKGEPHPELVALLEDFLEKARSGEISGMAFGYEFRDGGYSWGCVGSFNRARVVGALECIKSLLVRQLIDE